MSDEKKNETLTDRKKEVIQSIQRAAEIYTIASVCTKMPYVFCDPETFDDEVFVFLKLEDAQTAAKALAEEKEPVSLVKVENKHLLHFFSNLYTIGVNCVVVDQNSDKDSGSSWTGDEGCDYQPDDGQSTAPDPEKEKLIPCFTYKRKGVCAYDESYYYYHWQTVWKRRA